ncbi:MAG: serine/threonine-protein phosphatase PP2A catalytic subunit [Amphiamblys sp. WSBS2006]|nr:MAG: serine/threonine-protein phosphatase PP2A catalytic subunit [Amphiamblys sp. WSBS2006]
MDSADDPARWIESLEQGRLLSEETIARLCAKAQEILAEEENTKTLHSPVTVCGDIHGQFQDLREIFQITGPVPDTSYLFLGDYVDRGYNSVECICLLLTYKIAFPSKIALLRGNHDSRQITQVYGFYDECMAKYGTSRVWRLLTDLFDYLPITALIDNEVFCVHGGLSPDITEISGVSSINRVVEIPHDGPMCDLLWSDPDEKPGWNLSPRGAGYFFGPDVTREFNHRNNTKLIARAHQLVMNGYSFAHNNEVVTLFSAPNYCYRCGNMAAVMELDQGSVSRLTQYDSAPNATELKITKRLAEYFL